MKKEIRIEYNELIISNLNDVDRQLCEKAREASLQAYAPYSGFKVGAAVLLDNDLMVTGNNQENAAFPSGLCAERVALFSAASGNPGKRIKALAVYAANAVSVVAPCGACRQVMSEYEFMQDLPIRVLLSSDSRVLEFTSSVQLLPLVFNPDNLKK